MAEARDSGGKGAPHIGVDERHLRSLIVILVMHVLDEVQDVDIQACQPVHHLIVLVHHLIIIEIFRGDRRVLRPDLHMLSVLVKELLVLSAVDRVEQAFCQIRAGAEELHLLAGLRCAHAAADAVVVAPDGLHDIVILILNGGRAHRDDRRVAPEILRQTRAVQHGQVRFRGRSHILERVQEAVVGPGHHRSAVESCARDLQCRPDRIAGKQLVVARDARELDHAELHRQVVDQLLRLLFRQRALAQVALDIDVQEGRDAADAHRRAVLRLDCCEVAKIQPLNGFLRVAGGL